MTELSRGRLLGLAALLGLVIGIIETAFIASSFDFVFSTAREVRLFAVATLALDAVLVTLVGAVLALPLGAVRAWPATVFVAVFATMVAQLLGTYRHWFEGLGGGWGAAVASALTAVAATGGLWRLPSRLPRFGMVRRGFLVLLLVVVVVAVMPQRLPAVQAAGPNVLVIVVDTLRADRLGFAGRLSVGTPIIDRASRRGVVFEQATSVSNSTPSSIASLLTGHAMREHGVRSFHSLLSPSFHTVAEEFQEGGYRTFGFTSSFPAHLGYHQFDQGLDYRDDSSVPRLCRGCPPVEAVERLSLFRLTELAGWRLLPQNTLPMTRDADQTTDAVVDFLRWDGASPFFGFVHYFDPHAPYSVPRHLSGYRLGLQGIGRGDLDERFARADQEKPDWLSRPVDVRDPEFPVRSYDGEVFFVDLEIGRLVAELRRRGELQDTILAFTADHGENLLEHGRKMLFNHDGLFQTQIGVPMVLAGPGVPSNTIARAVVRSIDLAPTLTSLAGIPVSAPRAGHSLAPAWNGADEDEPRLVFTEAPHNGLWALRSGSFKLLKNEPAGPIELYDLTTDPGEEHDVALLHPGVTARLRAEAERRLGRRDADGGAMTLTPEQLEHLEALGYTGGDSR